MKNRIQAAAKTVWLIVICQSAAAVAQTYTAQNSPASPAQFKAIIQAAKAAHSVQLTPLVCLKPLPYGTTSALPPAASADADAGGPAITTFTVPGSISTFPAGYNFNFVPSNTSINSEGAITGTYETKVPITPTTFYVALHGFLRSPEGTFRLFDAPNAIATLDSGTTPEAINENREITGSFEDVSFAFHGFFRAFDGRLTVFDIPGSAGTFPVGINSRGDVVGNYINPSSGSHGFMRSRDGGLTLFDPPGVGAFGCFPVGINSAGTITGTYFDSDYNEYGFLRYRNGTYISFAITDPADGTSPTAIDESGRVTGYAYGPPPGFATHSFLRYADGTYTMFDPIGATSSIALGINSQAAVIGTCDSSPYNYLRTANGLIQTVNLPGPVQGINAAYEVPGFYYDSSSNTFIGYAAKLKCR